jgi:AcrR family transcriptional regulator
VADEPKPVVWARLNGQGRGPARTLDHAAITDAAVAIADADGLEAVSMRNIAARLGRSPMSLYRHVESKDDLHELMYDAVLGELDLPAAPSGRWRDDLAGLVRALRRLYHRHPWATRLGRRPTLGPNSVRLTEYSLAAVDHLGLDIEAMTDVVATALQFTQGFVVGEAGRLEARQRSGLDDEAYRRHAGPYVAGLIAGGRHPYLRRVVEEAEHDHDPDAVFERRLGMVLDGIAAAVDRTGSAQR